MELFLFMIHSTNTQRASAMCLALVWVPGRQRRAERRLFPYSSLSRESSREWENRLFTGVVRKARALSPDSVSRTVLPTPFPSRGREQGTSSSVPQRGLSQI